MTNNVSHKAYNSVDLHHIYGVNCYQNAIGFKPITLHFNESSGELKYLTLSPGDLAQILHTEQVAQHNISAADMKKLIIAGCRDDQLIELDARSPTDPFHVPHGHRLVAMFYSHELKDFDFHYYDEKNKKWKNKIPFAPESEIDQLPSIVGGSYTLTRLFICADNIQPRGVPVGEAHHYATRDIHLNITSHIKPWERGPSLYRHPNGFFLPHSKQLCAPPDLSFFGTYEC